MPLCTRRERLHMTQQQVAPKVHVRERDHHHVESTETKSSYKTTELIVYALAVLGVLIASALVSDASFGADPAWRYVTYLTVGYMISRGLAKAGSRDPYRD
jgi:DNA-binding XRE family transcriptional regulator